jgi:hypothetical protein
LINLIDADTAVLTRIGSTFILKREIGEELTTGERNGKEKYERTTVFAQSLPDNSDNAKQETSKTVGQEKAETKTDKQTCFIVNVQILNSSTASFLTLIENDNGPLGGFHWKGNGRDQTRCSPSRAKKVKNVDAVCANRRRRQSSAKVHLIQTHSSSQGPASLRE